MRLRRPVARARLDGLRSRHRGERMIDHETGGRSAAGEASALDPAQTFEDRPIGEYLRRQRLLRGMSTEELAALTRIPLRSLERLESGHFDGETDGFVRGFVRTVATALGLDADDAIARMLHEPRAATWERQASVQRLRRWTVVAALVVAGLIVFFVVRAGLRLIGGAAAAPAARDVVIWQDPVRALAEATGAELDSAVGLEPPRAPERR